MDCVGVWLFLGSMVVELLVGVIVERYVVVVVGGYFCFDL